MILLHPPRSSFWPKFASLPVYSALPLYLKLKSNINPQYIRYHSFNLICHFSKKELCSYTNEVQQTHCVHFD